MRHLDRLLAVAALGLASFALLARGPLAAPAVADPVPSADELGPADAVLLLDAKDRKDSLRLTNSGGRLSFGAAVDVDTCMKRLLATGEFADRRKEVEDEARTQEEQFRAQMQEIEAKYGNIGPNDPKFPEAQREANGVFEAMRRWREGQGRIVGKLAAEQIEAAYRRLVEAVEVVADREKVDLVYRFIPTAKAFETETMEAAGMQVRERTFLRSPESLDLTTEVLKELGVEDEG
jgi:galactokinase